MPRRCIAAGCDGVGGKDYSLHKFPKDEAIRKKWIKAVKEQRSNWNGPSPYSLLCSKHFTADCFISEGVRFRDDLASVSSLIQCQYARSIDYLGSTSSTSTAKSHAARPLSEKREEKRQQESVYCYMYICI